LVAAAVAALAAVSTVLSIPSRVDGEIAVERARYAFVIGIKPPFDEFFPRSHFERRVERYVAAEGVLLRAFGVAVGLEQVKKEYDRITATTMAPEQWEAMRKALGNDRRLIEEIVCRPLVVDRVLRARFDLAPLIHASPHAEARDARSRWLQGQREPIGQPLSISRQPAIGTTTEALLSTAKARSAGPQPLSPAAPTERERVSAEPALLAVLETQLRRPGDVTTIVEDRQQFRVFRLIDATSENWRVDVVAFPKVGFEGWFEKAARSVVIRPSAAPK
jgi:hypothetical protein